FHVTGVQTCALPISIVQEYVAYGERLRPYVADTALVLNKALDEDKVVLLEGAQGTLLDIDHGTYPFVTSSSPTAGGACAGSGIRSEGRRVGEGGRCR